MFSNNQDGRNYFNQVRLDNNQNFNELRDYDQGGPAKTILRPVPLVNARYMLIDWLNPFRAIYFPLAHQAGPGYEDLCVYMMIDFRLRQGVEMLSPGGGRYLSLQFDRERGLTYRHGDVMSFDLRGIYDYLILPPQLRAPEKGLYKTERRGDELITMWDRYRPTPQNPRLVTRPFTRHIDLVRVINDNFGVDVTWQPYQYSSWVVNFITHVTTLALGFVPVIGPLLSVSFSIGLQIIMDPEGFRDQNILHLGADIIAALIDSGSQARQNLPRSHQRSGAKILLIEGGSEEPAEQEAPYEENRIGEPETGAEDQGKDVAEQEAKDDGDLVAEDVVRWTGEGKGDDERNEAAKQAAEGEEKPVAKYGAEDRG